MSTTLSNRAMNLIQEMPWFSTKTQKACQSLNGKIEEFNSLLAELKNDSRASKESEVLITQTEIEEYRKRIFELLHAEVALREEVVQFSPAYVSEDARKEQSRLGEERNTIEQVIAEKLESIGYLPFNKAQGVQGSWKPLFIQGHPDKLNLDYSVQSVRAYVNSIGEQKRKQLELIEAAKSELRSMTEAALPAI